MSVAVPQCKFTLILRDLDTKESLLIPYPNTSVGFSSNGAPEVDKVVQHINSVFLIREDDDGIRPAEAPDECFYCKSKIGHHHLPDCVILARTELPEESWTWPKGETRFKFVSIYDAGDIIDD